MDRDELTQQRLKELLHYDPETGSFIWKRKKARANQGQTAGYISTNGYRYIKIDGKMYLAHRLVWLYIKGLWPGEQLDHMNHCRDDNRFDNLRSCSEAENHRNQLMYQNNGSGITGVCWVTKDRRWKAQISVSGQSIYLGQFMNKAEAIAARKAAEIEYGFHPNHGLEAA